ncbi:hypothetical protein MEI_00933 [Bartonella vinsonii subsp. arupensis Pm136co]|uniref:Uncharacterized protein n=2 Tax=Bartonella vinsonii TaxID=33047 RepID=A0ABP2QT55_BARVI|nr:hypothetical protein MEI_00933 [Bartonella vinsonii subsp. arupensis Pm136co]
MFKSNQLLRKITCFFIRDKKQLRNLEKRGKMRENPTVYKEARSFLFEEAFLSGKEYKVLFCLSTIIVVMRIGILAAMLLGWVSLGWQNNTLSIVLEGWDIVAVCLFVFIPVMFVLRILLEYLLKKNIQKLEEATRQRETISWEQ